jgi:hypothetical protein
MNAAGVESCDRLKPVGLSVDDLQGISFLQKRDWKDFIKSLVILLFFVFEGDLSLKRKIRNKSGIQNFVS